MRKTTVGVVAMVVVSMTAGGALGATLHPDLSVYGSKTTLQTGASGSVDIQIVNSPDLANQTGEASGTATAVEVRLESDGTPIDTRGGPSVIGTISGGETVPVTLPATVPDEATPGRYDLTAVVTYDYTTATGATDTTTVERPVTVTVADSTPFEIDSISADVGVGASGTMTVAFDNPVGDLDDVAVTARSTTTGLAVGQGSSQTRYVDERWDQGHLERVTFDVSVPPGTNVRELPVQFTVEYETAAGIERVSAPLEATITPGASQSATLSVTAANLTVGTDGTIDATVTNSGPDTLHNATVALQPVGSAVTPRASSQPLGTLSAGEQTSISYPVTVSPAADDGPRQFAFVVRYETTDDQRRQIGPLQTRLSVGTAPTFALDNVTTTLRVGEDGSITGQITNRGANPARGVVVALSTSAIGVSPGAKTYAVGRLDPDQRSAFRLPVTVSSGAEPGPRQIALDVQYRTTTGAVRAGDTHTRRVTIHPGRDTFDVEGANATLSAGASGTISIRITNQKSDPLTDLNVKLYADDPLSATSDEAYLQSLDPGATRTVTFDLSAPQEAPQQSHPVDIDVQYTEPDGDTVLSDTYQVPVSVIPESSSGMPVPAVGIGSLLVVGVGALAVSRFR